MVLAFVRGAGDTWRVQGRSDPNAELLDAAALCGHLVPEGSVAAFLAEHRKALFADELFEDLDAPVKRVAAQDTWVAYNPLIEREILPQTEDLERAMTKLLEW